MPTPAPPDPGDDPLELAARAWRDMRTLVLELHDRRQRASTAVGLSFVRIKALGLLAREPMSMRALAHRLAVDPPYVTLIAGDLERRGLLRRGVHPTDRRVKLLTITAAGRALQARAQTVIDDPPPALLALAREDLAQFAALLDALVAAGPPAVAEPPAAGRGVRGDRGGKRPKPRAEAGEAPAVRTHRRRGR